MTEANKRKVIKWLDAQIKAYNNRVLEIESEKLRLENITYYSDTQIHLNHNIDEIASILDVPTYSNFLEVDNLRYNEKYFEYRGFKFFALYKED